MILAIFQLRLLTDMVLLYVLFSKQDIFPWKHFFKFLNSKRTYGNHVLVPSIHFLGLNKQNINIHKIKTFCSLPHHSFLILRVHFSIDMGSCSPKSEVGSKAGVGSPSPRCILPHTRTYCPISACTRTCFLSPSKNGLPVELSHFSRFPDCCQSNRSSSVEQDA